jgi:hypothetical protein
MGFVCSVCGERHEERLMDLSAEVPEHWREVSIRTRLRSKLADSICWIRERRGEEHVYVRGLVELPVPELDDSFRFGVWAEISEDDFDAVYEGWDDGSLVGFEYPGTLDTSLDYPVETRGLPVLLREREGGAAPAIEVLDREHPLGREQHDGISSARVDEIVAAFVHG